MLTQNSPKEDVATSTGRNRVLVIQSRSEIARVLAKLLSYDGHEVHVATDGLEGASFAAAIQADVVFTAIELLGQDGFAVARDIRARLGIEPLLVATTSYSKASIRERLKEAGFNLYLAKPVSRGDLVSVMRVANGEEASESMAL